MRKVRGHYQYYGRIGNDYALSRYHCGVLRAWKKWLGRRSWRPAFTWDQFHRPPGIPFPSPDLCASIVLRVTP